MSISISVTRLILMGALIFGAYHETGMYTTTLLALGALVLELQHGSLHSLMETVDRFLLKGRD